MRRRRLLAIIPAACLAVIALSGCHPFHHRPPAPPAGGRRPGPASGPGPAGNPPPPRGSRW